MVSELLLKILRSVPRITFNLQPASKAFTLQFDSDYIQMKARFLLTSVDFRSCHVKSLLVYVSIFLFMGATLLLTITITWICQCCSQQNRNLKSRRRVRQLSLILFCLGTCLFGNEHLNRSITKSVMGADYISRNILFVDSLCVSLNDSYLKAIKHIDSLERALENVAKTAPIANKTALKELEIVLHSTSQKIHSLGSDLSVLRSALSGNVFLERSFFYIQRFELERWILCATLLSIMLVVLFVGVIAFCRQSKKGTVVFSALGFAIFIVGWLLLTAIFPVYMALIDFCADGNHFIKNYLLNETVDLIEFYRTCSSSLVHDDLPFIVDINKISSQLISLQRMGPIFHANISVLFNNSNMTTELFKLVEMISDEMINALKSVGALETNFACYTYHKDVLAMNHGFCIDGMPSDYVEVDEEDPFFTRGNDSTIPVDIYGSHVLNPRTLLANSLDHAEQSVATISAICGLTNGSANNHASVSTPLLDLNAEQSASQWHHGLNSPPASSSTANAPPAVGTNRFLYTMRMEYLTDSVESGQPYPNLQEQFNV
ncbi:unnamed protein product [Thelazia callipaeda]|uniref:Protein tweety homolog n=1 Tax=Thelazia callipaeda TaxID=103827 RepID=A0A0N5D2I6_THECL|nr:unnamed protein product [Thelazia callipaeda]